MGREEADAAEQLFLDKWYGIDVDDAKRIVTVAAQLDDQDLLKRPALVTAAMVSLQFQASSGTLDHAGGLDRFANLLLRSPDSAIGSSLSGVRLRQWKIMEMVARRWRREYDVALEISKDLEGDWEDSSIRDVIFRPHGHGLWPGHLSLQRGISEALGGELSAAMQSFTRAYNAGGQPPYWHYARANAAANAAMIAALEGNTVTAQEWIATTRTVEPVPAWIDHLTFVGRDIAEAQLAIDRLDVQEASRILDRIAAAGTQLELWPFLLHVNVACDLASGQGVRAYERLKEAGFQRNRISAIDAVADHLVFRSYLDVLVAMGEGGLVLRLANDLGHPLRSLIPVARTHLLSGDYANAARIASHALRRTELSLRDMWETTWVHALAEVAAGNSDSARKSFAIVRDGRPPMLAAMIRRSPRGLVEQLYSEVGEPLPSNFLPADDLAMILPKLTVREKEILQLLAEGLSPRAIAEREVTSDHTVRTHVKRIYRKLEVSNKHEAVARAEHLGLLRWAHLDGNNRVL